MLNQRDPTKIYNKKGSKPQTLPLCCVSLVAPTLIEGKRHFLGALWVFSAPRIGFFLSFLFFSLKRTTDMMFGGKQVVVCGYGEVRASCSPGGRCAWNQRVLARLCPPGSSVLLPVLCIRRRLQTWRFYQNQRFPSFPVYFFSMKQTPNLNLKTHEC